MIDPHNIVNFDRTPAEKQEFLIFAICVAGKTATVMAKSVHSFLWHSKETTKMPFETIRRMIAKGTLDYNLRRARIGKYTLLNKALPIIINRELDLQTCTPEELEEIPGVGAKTSRFFIVYTRPNQEYAVLDTHIIKWLKSIGHDIPDNIPQHYKKIEKTFLAECRERNLKVSDMDLRIWSALSSKQSLMGVIPSWDKRLADAFEI